MLPLAAGLFRGVIGESGAMFNTGGVLAAQPLDKAEKGGLSFAAAFGANVGMKTYAGPQITAFANGASIDIQNFAAAGAAFTYAKTTGLLQITDQASQTATIGFLNAGLGSGSFHISSDGGAGIVITHG